MKETREEEFICTLTVLGNKPTLLYNYNVKVKVDGYK